MFFWSIFILVIVLIVAGVCGEYQKAKHSDKEDAMQKFWENLGICVIIVLVFSMFLGYKYVNKRYEHRQYHNSKYGSGQIQYQGSQEQLQDLNAIDNYSNKHSDFE